ncbi:MAG: response regulator [Euryarchaeota archaeon]|nr:response regulator [Euryarchaeota archaeon]
MASPSEGPRKGSGERPSGRKASEGKGTKSGGAPAASGESQEKTPAVPKKGRPVRILLVEDSPESVSLFRDLVTEIENLDLDVEWCDRLSKALTAVKDAEYDVVFLDLLLPDSLGINTFERFDKEAPDVPKVVMSSLDDPSVTKRVLKEGAVGFLQKTGLTPHMLRDQVLEALKHRKTEEEKKIEELDPDERFRLEVLDHYPDGVFAFGWDASIKYSNRRARDLIAPGVAQGLFNFLLQSPDVTETTIMVKDPDRRKGEVHARLESIKIHDERVHIMIVRPMDPE